jgi:hypothetical protein
MPYSHAQDGDDHEQSCDFRNVRSWLPLNCPKCGQKTGLRSQANQVMNHEQKHMAETRERSLRHLRQLIEALAPSRTAH